MRDQLSAIALKDQHRSWATEGLAMFADILRQSDIDIESLGDQIVSTLVKYIGVHQGALFILNHEQAETENVRHLRLISYYAYERKKYESRDIEIHPEYADGLVGQAFLEKEKIFLSDLPEDYATISSGLGDSRPACLLIIPLKMNDQVEGVIELTALHVLKDYQIEFVERLSENIASTLVNVKSIARTRQLLEESQQQGEQMRAQEEEMRQNMEELAATQEEMRRKSNELEKLLDEAKKQEELMKLQQNETLKLNKMMQDIMDSHDAAFYVKDKTGRYTLVDRNFLNLINLRREEIIGRTDSDIFSTEMAEYFTNIDKEVLGHSKVKHSREKFDFAGNAQEYLVTRFPLFDQEGQKFALCGIIMSESWLGHFQ
jgi:PAS domain-containing protein